MSTSTVATIKETFFILNFPEWSNLLLSQRKTVQECQFTREPGQLVEEDQSADEQKQSAAEKFHGVEIFAKVLVENHELADAQSRKQKRNGQAGGIHGEQKNATGDGVAGGGESENGGQDGTDAGCPAESKREAEQKAAPNARLRGAAAQMHIAIEPTGHRRTEEADQREREEVHAAES